MKELMLLLSDSMPVEFILDQIEEAIKEHKLTKSDDSMGKIEMLCVMISTKKAIKSAGSVDALSRHVEEVENGMKVFKPAKN